MGSGPSMGMVLQTLQSAEWLSLIGQALSAAGDQSRHLVHNLIRYFYVFNGCGVAFTVFYIASGNRQTIVTLKYVSKRVVYTFRM